MRLKRLPPTTTTSSKTSSTVITCMNLIILLLISSYGHAFVPMIHPLPQLSPKFQSQQQQQTSQYKILDDSAFKTSSSSSSRYHYFSKSTSSRSGTTELNGIPKMFRWLTDQYPSIIKDRLEEGLADDVDVDNFYLDMNGIIHPCTHGNADGGFVVLDETAMFKKIFLYVDRLYKMVRPSKVLYLAVDGVAPRAKMNQQRSRRFRSAKEAEMLAAELVARDEFVGGSKKEYSNIPEGKERFDSNCITPGTDFMLKLSLAMQKWVEYKMKNDPFWKDGAKVIISGPDVPGEGEHKVMDFIRDTRKRYYNNNEQDDQQLYGPNWTHVLYGLDADLIMLGLVTHEPNFMLLREKMSVVMAGRGRNKQRKKKDMMEYDRNDFELLELNSLRKVMSLNFRKLSKDIPNYDLSRIIDDFVFMCILVGNDFLPHSPHLEIDGGAISLMLTTYMDLIPEWKGYLTEKEKIHPQRLEEFIYHISLFEEEHFKKRSYEENEFGWKLTSNFEEDEMDFYGPYFGGGPTPQCAVAANEKGALPPPSILKGIPGVDEDFELVQSVAKGPVGAKKYLSQHPYSQARSYRDFYYENKLSWRTEDRDRTLFLRRQHVRNYIEGLHWVLHYYHNGCQSWDWYFPYLYAPLTTDMVNLNEFYESEEDDNNDSSSSSSEYKCFPFDLGKPFPSLAQLLSVLPPQSAKLLPKPLGELMVVETSPLISYYPSDFVSDPNGKRQPWEAVVQIPFIESGIMLDTVNLILQKDAELVAGANGDDDDEEGEEEGGETTMKKKKGSVGGGLLTPSERRRNVPGRNHLYVPPGLGKNKATTTTTTTATRTTIQKKKSNGTSSSPSSRNGQKVSTSTTRASTSTGTTRASSTTSTTPKGARKPRQQEGGGPGTTTSTTKTKKGTKTVRKKKE